ncbi:hypothetical protein E0H66_23055 [Rhizobium leguminosarum bv. viciae]|uniref:hypothetical protein n=1 Tax=Rhizobium leguminosarum TaxID=384 RepID=UPI00103F9C6D|nr:hypothetical protein [Rhizobium leguminosarum]MBY5610909.1 hypothetical protein [Rhizobium leguminosarum]TCA32000.1 hypothetical protein E0H66_23055 [Rhizobium leguminosarum bv. viciae]
MDDPSTYGAEIAALTVSRLKAIGLSIEEVSSKQERMERAKASVGVSIALGRQAQIDNGMSPSDADAWSKSAHAAFNSSIETARRDLASPAADLGTAS